MDYDLIIVGAGPAGLACALRAKKEADWMRILVLEKSAAPGGRTRTIEFAGIPELPCGAGVGRTRKDRRLWNLLGAHGIPRTTWSSEPTYAAGAGAVAAADRQIRSRLRQMVAALTRSLTPAASRTTFQDYATRILGPADYAWFVEKMGYRDFERADAWETVRYYGFEDNYRRFDGFTVPWNALASAMAAAATAAGIEILWNTEVLAIRDNRVETAGRQLRSAARIIVATDVAALRRFFPENPHYAPDALDAQPFLRIYAKLTAASEACGSGTASAAALRLHDLSYQIVPGPLQKISRIRDDVYRIAYCDNANAVALSERIKNTPENRAFLAAEMQKALGHLDVPPLRFAAIRGCFKAVGTHYYPPLPAWATTRAQFRRGATHPAPNIWVVGEAVSRDQGWTEGALESVDYIWPHFVRSVKSAKNKRA